MLIIGLAALAAQAVPPAPQTPQPPPRFRAETNFVRVDAYVTRDGVPVQDLSIEDFEIFEDDTPQKIESFEHIVVQPGPQSARAEPSSPTAANQLAADPRRRVFVIYLDHNHVGVAGSHAIKEPLIDLVQRVLSDDDLVAMMTPDMSPSHLTFSRRTNVIEEFLRKNWAWGRRGTLYTEDDRERMYDRCFPPGPGERGPISALARALILRRRERLVLDSFQDLARHMSAIREGRTAIVTVSDGWVLFGPDESLMKQRTGASGAPMDPMPGTPPPVGVGPGGSLTARPNKDMYSDDRTECDKDRTALALADNQRYFRDILEEARRANVSFYTIDPRGLSTSDDPGGVDPPIPAALDRRNLTSRSDSLMTLAHNTDGLALVNNNDLRGQLRRVADDLTSYYLMGYYSTNGKLDGRYRSIKVRSKRPGVQVRARRGYNTPSAKEIETARTAAAVPVPENRAAIARALGAVESDARAQGRKTARVEGDPMVFHRGPATGNQLQVAAGRVFPRSARIRMEMEAEAAAPVWTAALLDRNGTRTIVPVAVGERTDAASGQRWLTADVTLAPLGPGDYVVELSTTRGSTTHKTLVGFRVTP